jgi:aspartyl-tRNA(Asn)/glutamyl-tRNA(Gln) amidotransferase subunit B
MIEDPDTDPEEYVRERDLLVMNDSGELEAVVDKVIAENAETIAKIQEGNTKAVGALIGAVMRETKGRADGGEVNRLIQERL